MRTSETGVLWRFFQSQKGNSGLIAKLRPLDCEKSLVRIGADNDGGYLLPDDLEDIEYCFSPGVSRMVDFESHLATKNIRAFLADYSIDSPPIEKPEFTFDKTFLGAIDTHTFFTLGSWKDKYLKNYADDVLLQMDIEVYLSTREMRPPIYRCPRKI